MTTDWTAKEDSGDGVLRQVVETVHVLINMDVVYGYAIARTMLIELIEVD